MTGTGILKAFDFDGKELWTRDIQKDYGRFGLNWGYASSPLLHDDALYVQVLHGMKTDDPSYVLQDRQEDRQDGVARRAADATRISESPDSYTTPALLQVRHDDRDRHHRRRRRHRPRSGDRQGALARRRPQSRQPRRLPHRRVADRRRRPDHRADARQPAGGAASPAAAATSPTSHVAWTFTRGGPTCRRR